VLCIVNRRFFNSSTQLCSSSSSFFSFFLFLFSSSFPGFNFTFYVAPLMSAEEQRQHIGNAPILLFFCEDGADPAPTFRGSVNFAAIVAKYNKKEDTIRFSVFSRRSVSIGRLSCLFYGFVCVRVACGV
jgi:hypothetical protein